MVEAQLFLRMSNSHFLAPNRTNANYI